MPTKGSNNHVWFQEKPLGHGATGSVFEGRHKKTGEKRAVKCFNPESRVRPTSVQMREFEVMRSINHENVVRLYDIEKESQSEQQVIVMELCQHGSLYCIIDQPEHGFGMPEDEYLTMLQHTAAGMKHLHGQGIVHRDLKPGNILKAIAPNGSSVYKITDFGAARFLAQEEQEYTSLYGTEEYLHPNVYERAVLRRHTQTRFDAKVDLWSLGVTYYHAATGQLPFRPYGGRKNKATMYDITTKKPLGAISGVQEKEGGEIEYSHELPPTCRLSQGLRLHLTRLLAGLLERDPRRTMSFAEFFEQVEVLVGLSRLTVFSVHSCETLRVYLPKDSRLMHVKEALAQQTDLPAGEQLLLHQHQLLDDSLAQPDATLAHFPHTSPRQPIVLLPRKPAQHPAVVCPMPPLPKPESSSALSADLTLAKRTAAAAHYLKTRLQETLDAQQTLHSLMALVWSVTLVGFFNQLNSAIETSSAVWKRTEFFINFFLESERVRFEHHLKNGFYIGTQQKILKLFSDIEAGKDTIKTNFLQLLQLQGDFKKPILDHERGRFNGCAVMNHCELQSDAILSNIKETLSDFRKDKSQTVLNYNEEQIHKYEKQRLLHNVGKLQTLLEKHCLQRLRDIQGKLYKTLSTMWQYHSKLKKQEALLCEVNARIEDIEKKRQELEGLLGNFPLTPASPAGTGTLQQPISQESESGFGSGPAFRDPPAEPTRARLQPLIETGLSNNSDSDSNVPVQGLFEEPSYPPPVSKLSSGKYATAPVDFLPRHDGPSGSRSEPSRPKSASLPTRLQKLGIDEKVLSLLTFSSESRRKASEHINEYLVEHPGE